MDINYSDFDWFRYIQHYDDLKICLKTKKDAIQHWENHGKYENRIYFKNISDLSNYDNFDNFDNFDWENI